MEKIDSDMRDTSELKPPSIDTDILNPFVHRLELDTTYEKLKTAFLTVALLPLRLAAITALVIIGWLLACLGLHGLSEDDLRRAPLTGWRRDMRVLVCWVMRAMFVCGGFHQLKVKGQQATTKDAPVLALAPHSSFFDALPVVYLGGPSIVAKAETGKIPFFGSRSSFLFLLTKIVPWLCFLGRLTYTAAGMKIVVRGRQASRSEAPILVVAPHSTFIDGGIVYILGFPSTIVRRESGLNPFTGKLINYTQPVYVWRDDPNSRQNTIKEIIERATSKEDWPQIMIFPEGTCTNRSCLITFKCGAFYPGVPVQPVCIRYPNKLDTVTWTWEGPGALKLLWLTLTQLNSSCEIEFLPVYRPSEAEKTDPKLYANNVRRLMAEALEIPVSDYTYDDCRIINKAHMLHLPYAAVIVEAHKLRCKLGLQKVKVEEELVQKRLVNIEETVNFNEFARILRLDAKDPSVQQLFRIHDRTNKGTIDIEEYMFTVLAIANANSVLDLVDIAFDVCDANGTKCLDNKKLRKALKLSLQLEPEESDRIFSQASHDVSGGEAVSFEDVITVLGTRTEFSHIFADDSEGRRKKTI
ncbi:Similar to LPCAT: Lysophosphatidylcholine acyltransferase (Drosophila melanogaster) [Cotesia congregata]|uniref:Similar to LPCAT: Lysophosphatidylcholine acyltransferase (Drosophila melanogaster) n=1 Tax=Cotesia congregata TaxID=51543 RepID=A0A8J2H9B6_COTCN|nr:Similar to LPCAT: Lysophosphatidylcholine acyltransferase (Drosophila melanogaster) [Cotesia congregata]